MGFALILFISESEVDYHRLANLPEVSVICDIEFNAGHCPITFLQANKNTIVLVFDIARLPRPLDFLSDIFNPFQGDSA